MRDIFEKFPREDQNPGGGVVPTPPPLGVRRWIFTLGVRGLKQSPYNDLIFLWSSGCVLHVEIDYVHRKNNLSFNF